MKNLTNYIVFHDQTSFELFQENNKELDKSNIRFIYVGKDVFIHQKLVIHNACFGKDNIEDYPSLLTFTAWYLIANNDICPTDFVGIFEYDVKFSHKIDIELKENTIYGVNKRNLPDSMFLEVLPKLKELMNFDESKIPYWNSTSNFIMPMKFLKEFVDWYMAFIPEILGIDKHSHFHERAINIFAANNGYKNETIEGIEHLELNSHGIRL
jgi:hypothetical protein